MFLTGELNEISYWIEAVSAFDLCPTGLKLTFYSGCYAKSNQLLLNGCSGVCCFYNNIYSILLK